MSMRGMEMGNYYSEENHGPHHYFELGDFELENAITPMRGSPIRRMEG
jgi:hypothetical protein